MKLPLITQTVIDELTASRQSYLGGWADVCPQDAIGTWTLHKSQ